MDVMKCLMHSDKCFAKISAHSKRRVILRHSKQKYNGKVNSDLRKHAKGYVYLIVMKVQFALGLLN